MSEDYRRLRAAIYARMSTDNQSQDSPADLWVDHGEVDAARAKLADLKDERAKLEAWSRSLSRRI